MSVVLALVIAGIFPAASLYAWHEASDTHKGPEFGRGTALAYILQSHEKLGGLEVPSAWRERNLTPEGWVGSNTVEYTSGGWTVKVSNAVVQEPVYTIEVELSGDAGFQWKGTVDQEGNVVEIEFAMAQ
ncbi:MAG: hypothetical protein JSV18_08090 [Candidatus Bathyarchaeota archaeon]|nr:MAG: hypothetical protein JSV18_08090 [Candidatus Bathyarchaeota archaeon]